ncbi:hypothetical protein ACJMK2_010849 [Sinanodonta woodiana]|uniref:RING-type domain-containing protein n=1 Tax=Sinanodonta woodiana TaxID=1069815 RepID=A0ABD3VI95_SINWO
MEMEAVSDTVLSQQSFITEVKNSFDFEDNLIKSICHDFCCDESTSSDFYMAARHVTKVHENHMFCCDENTCKVFMLIHAETRETSDQTSASLSLHHVTDVTSVRSGHQMNVTSVRSGHQMDDVTSVRSGLEMYDVTSVRSGHQIDDVTSVRSRDQMDVTSLRSGHQMDDVTSVRSGHQIDDVTPVRSGHQMEDASENHIAKAAHKSKHKKTKKMKQKEKLAKLMQKYKPPEGKCRNTSRYAESFQELLRPRGFDSEMGNPLTCPVCLELYFRPHLCYPCQHIFCEPCLRKLTTVSAEYVPCPLCRNVIQSCSHDKDLDQRLKVDYPDIYQERAMIEKLCKSRYKQLPLTYPHPLSRRLLQTIIQGHQARRWIIDRLLGLVHSSLAYLLPLGFGFTMSFLLFLYNGKMETESQVEFANTCFLVMVLGLILAYIIHKSHLLRFATLNG